MCNKKVFGRHDHDNKERKYLLVIAVECFRREIITKVNVEYNIINHDCLCYKQHIFPLKINVFIIKNGKDDQGVRIFISLTSLLSVELWQHE